MNRARGQRQAFSLVELVIVVVIIGVISAIAVPRLGQSARRSTANATQLSVANVRNAIDRYFAEHDRFPGYDPSTLAASNTWFPKQLMEYSDRAGKTNATKTSVFLYGPYLRKPFPTNPFNDLDTVHVKATRAAPDPADGSVGWIAVLSTGDFGISATDADLDDVMPVGTNVGADPRGAIRLNPG